MMVRTKLVLALTGLGLLGIGSESEPGWLARALANTDADVDAASRAYEAEDYAAALERLDAAVARRGERSELHYNRGLVLLATGDLDGARERFQHGTTSEHPQVRASSHYQLGNLAFIQEDWQAAIDAYIECLRVQPDHQNAKWNLELALERKREQDEREQQEQDEQDQDQDQDQDDQDQDQDQDQDPDQDQGDEGDQDQQDQEQDQGEQDEQDQGEQDQGEQDQEQDQEQQDQEQQDEPDRQPDPQEASAQAIDGADVDAALEELDRQDTFMFGRPRGSRRPVEKDW
jgi:Ca-activated chloride channel homolog